MSAMSEMSKAIREQLHSHGETLKDIPILDLLEYETILGAYLADIRGELDRRRE